MANFYTSDLHLCSKANMIKYDSRPFSTLKGMQDTMIENWNNTITNGDTVYILGDIDKRGYKEEVVNILGRLKGHLIAIKGNHDSFDDYRLRRIFSDIKDYKEITDHIIDPENPKSRLRFNIILSCSGTDSTVDGFICTDTFITL